MSTDNQPTSNRLGSVFATTGTTRTTDDTDVLTDLAWAVLDGYASEVEVEALERLLTDSAESRATYTQCVLMHGDLQTLFGGTPAPPTLGEK